MKKQMMSRRLFIALMVAVEVFCLVFAVAFYAYNVVTTFLPFLDRLATKLENDGAIERDSASDPDHALPPSERLVRAIEAYMDEHIAEDNSISEICTAFSISQPYLSRIGSTGTAPTTSSWPRRASPRPSACCSSGRIC